MSHYKIKTKYNTEGPYGSIEEKCLYAHHNLTSDYVTFYDDNGEYIFIAPSTIDNNILDAINRLFMPFKDGTNNFVEGVEGMSKEDRVKCGMK